MAMIAVTTGRVMIDDVRSTNKVCVVKCMKSGEYEVDIHATEQIQ